MNLTPLQKITYGIYVVGCYSDGKPAGCIINTCFQVTSENPALAISLNKNNFTLEAIRRNPHFSLSIVAEDTDPAIIGKFGFCSSRDNDKYAGFGYQDLDGTPAVNGQFCGRLILEAFDFVDCGTHIVVIGRLKATYEGAGRPMTYAYYHEVIKGSAPKNAPTYREEPPAQPQPASGHVYKCDVCGYTVESDGPLPDDFVCPICGVDRSHFKEI
ncbi:MAG: flavin reductase [Paramuribaculum sp.]|nr:flavin reductase [Paramuribaculum sp.]